jgi:tagatose 6-phosphate kinase
MQWLKQFESGCACLACLAKRHDAGAAVMILCVNPNAAIDKTVVVENFQINAIHRPSFELALPGGKGCNVARVLKVLGQQPVVTGWVGGHAGNFIEQGLQAEGIYTAFVHTTVESRTCLSVLDSSQGTMTEIYEKGRPVSPAELEAFYNLLDEWLPRVDMITLSGSLPPGVPTSFYAEVIRRAREKGVRSVLDSSGEALRLGLEEGPPDFLKCNRSELAGLVGESLEGLGDLQSTASWLADRWKIIVVVTVGGAGAVAAEPDRGWLAQAPLIEAVSAVGSGDSFLAGLVSGLLTAPSGSEGNALENALPLAIAAGSANALQIGAGCLRPGDIERLLDQVRIATY